MLERHPDLLKTISGPDGRMEILSTKSFLHTSKISQVLRRLFGQIFWYTLNVVLSNILKTGQVTQNCRKKRMNVNFDDVFALVNCQKTPTNSLARDLLYRFHGVRPTYERIRLINFQSSAVVKRFKYLESSIFSKHFALKHRRKKTMTILLTNFKIYLASDT